METVKDILYDDVEQKFIELQDKKKRRRKRWRRIKMISILTIVIVGTLYFCSDYSKVKSLSVSGNTYYSDEEILSMTDLSYETRYLVMPGFFISWKLEKYPMIDRVEVSKNMYGVIHLTVYEKPVLGYVVEDETYSLITIQDPFERILLSQEEYRNLPHYPLIQGFDDENLQKLVNGFKQSKREVKSDVISMISEIHAHSRSYEAHMIKMNMQDGNIIYSFYDGVPLLNDYKKVLREEKGSHGCYEMDEENSTIWETKCE